MEETGEMTYVYSFDYNHRGSLDETKALVARVQTSR